MNEVDLHLSNMCNLLCSYQLLQVIQTAERIQKPAVADLFSDVYDIPPKNLNEQEDILRKNIMKHAQDYPSDVPV